MSVRDKDIKNLQESQHKIYSKYAMQWEIDEAIKEWYITPGLSSCANDSPPSSQWHK